MPDALLNEYAKDQSITEILYHSKAQHHRFFTAQDNSPANILYMAEQLNNQNQTDEHHKEWRIYWFSLPHNITEVASHLSQTNFLSEHPRTPLYVFAYENDQGRKIPVTGDYDLACIIPDKDYLLSDGNHITIHHDNGGSVSSSYGDFIIDQLNQACSQTVFRHGAEAQNIEFAQPIDNRLICITPARFAYIVPKESMAEASYDLICRRKIIKWNPAYDQNDLPLNGKYFGIISPTAKKRHQSLYDELCILIENLRQKYHEAAIHHLYDTHRRSIQNTQLHQETYPELILTLKDKLLTCLADHKESNSAVLGRTKAQQLTEQLTDILLYQERLKVYLTLASQENAPQSFFCFDYQDFSEDKNGTFIENAHDRHHWIKTIEQVVRKTGDEDFKPRMPPRVSTTDDITDTMSVVEKNEVILGSLNTDRRRSIALFILPELMKYDNSFTVQNTSAHDYSIRENNA